MEIYQPGTDFFESRHAPYYIASPPFTQKTAGPRVLHYLCHILNELGYEAYITTDFHSAWLRTPLLTPDIREKHKQTNRTPIVIYPETITANPLNGVLVVRWLLNQAGHLGGEKKVRKNEMIFHLIYNKKERRTKTRAESAASAGLFRHSDRQGGYSQ